MSDYPAVFRNAAGDLAIVPNQRSGPIGFYRDPDHAVASDGTIIDVSCDPVEQPPAGEPIAYGDNEGNGEPVEGITVLVDNDEDEADALNAMKDFGR